MLHALEFEYNCVYDVWTALKLSELLHFCSVVCQKKADFPLFLICCLCYNSDILWKDVLDSFEVVSRHIIFIQTLATKYNNAKKNPLKIEFLKIVLLNENRERINSQSTYLALFLMTRLKKAFSFGVIFSPFERCSFMLKPHLLHIFCPHHFKEVFFHLVCDQRQVTHPGQQQLTKRTQRNVIQSILSPKSYIKS